MLTFLVSRCRIKMSIWHIRRGGDGLFCHVLTLTFVHQQMIDGATVVEFIILNTLQKQISTL